jgi:hypothetical protein
MKPGDSKADKQTIQDEADATVREGARQAMIERDRAIAIAADAAREAHDAAAAQETAPEATRTFWQKFRDRMAGYP